MTNQAVSASEEPQNHASHPVVSIVMPAYNVEDYIQRSIESALQQTIPNIEVIVVDDASRDSTLQVARAYAEADSRVKVIANPVNQGAAVARNLALDVARGDWICILDSDDWMSPQRLEFLLQKAEETSADLMADDLAYVNNMESDPWTSFVILNGDTYTGLTEIGDLFYVHQETAPWQTSVSPGFLKPIIRRSLIENNRIRYKNEIRLGQDFFFFLDCLLCGGRFFLYPEAHYFYRARPDSLVTKSQLERATQAEMGLYEVLKDERVTGNPDLHRALLAKLDSCIKRRQYQSVVVPLKQKKYFKAIVETIKYPHVLVQLGQKVTEKLRPQSTLSA